MSAYGPDPSAPTPPVPPSTPVVPANGMPAPVGQAPAPLPGVPGRDWYLRSPGHAVFRGAVALLLIATGILGQVAGSGFPSNAPVEMFMNFGITVVFVGSGIALAVFAALAGARRSVRVVPGRFSALVLAGAIAVVISAVLWIVTTPGQLVPWLEYGERMRFSSLIGSVFFTGPLIGAGIVLAAVGFRTRHLASRIVATVAILLGLGLGAWVVYAAAIYSAGITD